MTACARCGVPMPHTRTRRWCKFCRDYKAAYERTRTALHASLGRCRRCGVRAQAATCDRCRELHNAVNRASWRRRQGRKS